MRNRSGLATLVMLATLFLGGPTVAHEAPPAATDAAVAQVPPSAEGTADPVPQEQCSPRGRWTMCWHADVPPPGAPRTPRSLRRMRREVGGVAGLRPFRSTEPGSVIDVDRTGLGGAVGPVDGGIDPATGRSAVSPAAGTPGILCVGNGTSGNRVQAVYAYTGSNRASQIVPLIRRWAADVEITVRVSAQEQGATRHVRWVHTGSCVLSVMVVKVSKAAIGDFNRFIDDLSAKGLKRSDRRYLTWFDANALCGIGTMMPYDQPGAGNPNNGFPVGPSAWTRVDRGCWGLRSSQDESVEAHELFHNLGAVQDSAPNSSRAGHCNDEWDVMCYADGGPRSTMHVSCDSRSHNALLDCGHDDYFAPGAHPPAYLKSHWNTARSSFLDSGSGAAPTLYDLAATVPTDGQADATARVPLSLKAISDSPLASVELAAAADGTSTFTAVDNTGGTILEPVVTLARGHRWTVSAVVVDTRGRRSAALTTTFDLPRDEPPVASNLELSLQGYDAGDGLVSASWDEQDDNGVVDRQVQVSSDAGTTWAAAGGTAYSGSWEGSLARGAAYRLRVRLKDTAVQWGAWVQSTPLDIPSDQPPTVTKPIAAIEDSGLDTAYVSVGWQSDDDGYVAQEDIFVRTDGAARVLLAEAAYPGDWVEVATGHAYRFIIRVTDNAGNITDSEASDELSVP